MKKLEEKETSISMPDVHGNIQGWFNKKKNHNMPSMWVARYHESDFSTVLYLIFMGKILILRSDRGRMHMVNVGAERLFNISDFNTACQ